MDYGDRLLFLTFRKFTRIQSLKTLDRLALDASLRLGIRGGKVSALLTVLASFIDFDMSSDSNAALLAVYEAE